MTKRDDETWRGMVVAALICLAITLVVVAFRFTVVSSPPVPSVPAFSLERLRGG